MSICPYNKNTKSNPVSTPTNASNKSLKDERPGSHHPSKGPARRQQQGHFDNKKNNIRHWKHQRVDGQRKEGRFEKYAPGGSYVNANGTVKDGSKKVSLNHLLNFKFEPRHYEDTGYSNWSAAKPSRVRTSSCTAYNKERFLQANSRFLTKKGEDYSIHATDPDAVIPWEYVEKVLFQVNDDATCPICLYPPTVPKITRCGHIYCWPCILHYLALDENGKSVRDCPICAVNVRKADLRSVSFLETQPLLAGCVLKMNLMARKASSLSPTPISEVGDHLFDYENAKFMEYSPEQVLECIVEPEMEMLKARLSLEVDEFEKEFLNCALADCDARKVDLLMEISGVREKAPNLDVRSMSVNNNAEQATSTRTNSQDQTSYYYFYQIEGDGYVFLDGINVKCLLKEYSHFKECPPVIEAPMVHVETFIMTEELRKRHKYLSHLPLSCEYRIVELDLRPPLVSQETLDGFATLMKQRMQSRQRKERQENDARKRADIVEARKWRESVRGAAFLSDDSVVVSASIQIEGATKSLSSVGSYSSDMSLSPPGQVPGSMSFAEKLRCSQGNVTSAWPLKDTMKRNVLSQSLSGIGITCDEDDDPYYHAPAFQSSFGDALTAALDNMQCTSSDTRNDSTESAGASKGRKAKKKKKQTLLFSTSAHMRP